MQTRLKKTWKQTRKKLRLNLYKIGLLLENPSLFVCSPYTKQVERRPFSQSQERYVNSDYLRQGEKKGDQDPTGFSTQKKPEM